MSATILVFSDKESLRAELLGKAREVADALGGHVAAVTFQGDASTATLGDAGADVVYPIPAAAAESPERLEHALAEVAKQSQAGLVLIGATKPGMEAAAVLAERLDAAYAPWTVRFTVDASGALTAYCMLFAGSGLAAYTFTPGLTILTAAPGAFTRAQGAGKAGQVVQPVLSEPQVKVVVTGSRTKAAGASSLEDARAVIDVGQGVKAREDLALVETVAGLLDGQLACTRPVSSDRDWFADWLGLSGKKIKPELCLTVGISGAIQHIVGIRDSRVIAAVNNDEGAAIHSQADYAVVADLYEFLPALAERIQARGVHPAWKA